MTIEDAKKLADNIITFVDGGADDIELLKKIRGDIDHHLVLIINGHKDMNIDNCRKIVDNTPVKVTYNQFREMEGDGKLYAGLVYKGVGFEIAPVYK